MLHLNPDMTAASMTNMKPQNSNSVSFATVTVMMDIDYYKDTGTRKYPYIEFTS